MLSAGSFLGISFSLFGLTCGQPEFYIEIWTEVEKMSNVGLQLMLLGALKG